jgi:hypothetical protein
LIYLLRQVRLRIDWHYLTDAMGSVIGLADSTGAEVADFRYDSFGNLRSSTGAEVLREIEKRKLEVILDFRVNGWNRLAICIILEPDIMTLNREGLLVATR